MFFLIYIVAILFRYSFQMQKMLKTQCNIYVYYYANQYFFKFKTFH